MTGVTMTASRPRSTTRAVPLPEANAERTPEQAVYQAGTFSCSKKSSAMSVRCEGGVQDGSDVRIGWSAGDDGDDGGRCS